MLLLAGYGGLEEEGEGRGGRMDVLRASHLQGDRIWE